jgi:hypothetical protein
MGKTSIFLGLSLLIATFACHPGQVEKQREVIAEMAPPPPASQQMVMKYAAPRVVDEVKMANDEVATKVETTEPVNKKKIIKDGNISVKAKDLAASKKNMDGLIKAQEAYYLSEEMDNNDQSISFHLKARIPAASFEKFIALLENGKDEIVSKSIQARDVTEEFSDLETRLANKREYLKRYRELLSKAATVKDILAIEENVRTLQEEIESREGRLKYLNDQVAYSTLDIYLFQTKEFQYKPEGKDNFFERVKKSLGNGWNSVVSLVLWIISIWPFLILALLVFVLWKRVIRKQRTK